MNPTQAAEDAIALVWGPASNEHTLALREALKGLLTHARTLSTELARKTKVADAYWEIVESYKAENAELRAAIKQGAEWFREYEAGHQAQADAEDHRTRKADRQDKANRNRDRAEFLERALAAQDGGAANE